MKKTYNYRTFWNVRAVTHKGHSKVLPSTMTTTEVEEQTAKQVAIIKKHCLNKNAIVLDAGCGIGRITTKLVAEGYNVVGVDASRSMIKIAKRTYPKMRFRVADLKALPFNDNTFSLVFELSVLLHVPNNIIETVVNEFKRVSKSRILIFPSAKYFEDTHYIFYRSIEDYIKLFVPFQLVDTELVESKWGIAKAMLFEKEV